MRLSEQVAYVVREVINIDRDYESGTVHFPQLRFDIVLHKEDINDVQVLEFHRDMVDFIRKYRFEKGRRVDNEGC